MLETLAWIGLGASLVPAHRAADRRTLVLLVAVELIAVALVVLAYANEDAWAALAQEDGIVEWATFVAFALAAGWLVVVVRRRSASWWFKGACFLLAAFCLVVAGEEISWGQRLLGFKPPDVFLERNFQQELNLHNVLMDERGLGFALESKHLVIAIALGFGVVWPLLVRTRRLAVFAPLAPPLALAPLAIAIAAIELSYPVDLTGEGAELVTGLLFLASALAATEHRERTSLALLAAPLAAGLVISSIVTRLMFGSDEEGTRTAAAELAILQADIQRGATQKLVGRNVHKRVFTAARDGYLNLTGAAYLEGQGTPAHPGANPRRDRRGYFLDPWNNPYWIHFDRKSQIATLYSFGPDRRRDVRVRDPDSDEGDDVVVRFGLVGE